MGGMARYLLPVVAPAATTPAQFEALVNAALAPLLAQRILAFDLVVTDKLPAYERTFQVMIDYEDGGSTMSSPFQLRVVEAPDQTYAAKLTTDYVAANPTRYIAPAQYEYTDQLPNIQNRCLVFIVSGADSANAQKNYLASATGGGSGGGSVSSVGLSAPSIFSVSGSPVTTSGVLGLALVVQAAATFFAGPILGADAAPAFRTIRTTDLPAITFGYLSATPTTLAGYGITDAAPISHVGSNGVGQHALATNAVAGFMPVLSGSASQYLDGTGAWSTPAGGGSVTSVALAAPSQFNVTGSPVTGAGTLTFAWNNQAVNTVLAGPGSGGSAAPTFRSLVIADLPVIPFSYITSTPTTLAGYGITNAAPISHVGSGGVSQHALATAGAAGFMPVLSSNALQYLDGTGAWSVPAGSGSGSVTSVGLALPVSVFSISGSPVTVSGTLTGTFINQAANVIFAGPSSGGAAPPTFRTLVTTDLPAITFGYLTSTPTTLAGYGITNAAPISHVGSGGVSQHAIVTTSAAGFAPVLSNVATQFLNGQGGWTVPAGSGGTVTSVGLSLPGEFNVTNSPVTTTGTLTAAWVSATQNWVFAAPSSSSGTPAFRALVIGDLPAITFSYITAKPTTLAGYGITDAAPISHVGSGGSSQHAVVTTSAAGFAPVLSNVATQFLNGQGGWTVPAGTGTIGGSIASTQIAVGSGANTISGSSVLTSTAIWDLYIQPAVHTGNAAAIVVGPVNHTGIFATTETSGYVFSAQNKQWATGAIAIQREFFIQNPVYSFVGASTITTAATLVVVGAPTAGTNATITNSYALWIQDGAALFESGTSVTTAIQSNANVNNFSEMNRRNTNAGSSSSTDYVVTADNGTASTHYADFGMNGSTGGVAPFVNANAAYLYTTDNEMNVSALGTAGVIKISGGATATTLASFDVVSGISLTPAAVSSGAPAGLVVTGAANTNMTTLTEVIGANFNFSAIKQWATGAIATQREMVVRAPTYAFVGGSTITTAATFAISGAPIAGTNATITSAYALWVQSGTAAFAASTTSVPSIILPPGGIPASPVDGAMWVTTAGLFVRIAGVTVGPLGAGGGGTIGGSIASTQVAVGSGANTIAGSAELTYSASQFVLTPASVVGGGPTAFTITAAGNSSNFTGAEIIDVNISLQRSTQWTAGAITTQRAMVVSAPTYTFTGASIITNAATFAITDAPTAGANATLTNSYALWVQAGASRFDGRVSLAGIQTNGTPAQLDVSPVTVATSGTPKLLRVTGLANTGMTANVEVSDVVFNLARTTQFTTGTAATQRAFVIQSPTYSATAGGGLFTNAATFAITGAPAAGANMTLTNTYAVWVQSGASRFDDRVSISGNQTTGTAAHFDVAPIANGNGTPLLMAVTAAANTGIVAATEVIAVNFNLAATQQWLTTSFATQRAFVVQAPTYAFTGASTITTAATVAITNAPTAGANATITNAHALWVQAGRAQFDGVVVAASDLTVSGIFTAQGTAVFSGAVTFPSIQVTGAQLSTATAQVNIAPVSIATSGTPKLLTITGAANTGMTTLTEVNDVNINLARTVQWATGGIATQRAFLVQAPTYAFVGASTITTSATLAVTGAPVAGTNATLSSSWAVWVQSGGTRLDGRLSIAGAQFNSTLAQFDLAPATISTSGTPLLMRVNTAANTGITSGECLFIDFNLSAIQQFATGAIATQRAFLVRAPTYAFVGASTITTAGTFVISGAPIAGTNATITTPYALWVQTGVSFFGGASTFNALVNINAAVNIAGTQANGATAHLNMAPTAAATGTPKLILATGAANTNMTLNTEVVDANFNLARTVQWATSSSFATQRAFLIQAPTYGAVGASTITTAATFAITGAPVAGTNMTLTTPIALWVQSGRTSLDGVVAVSGTQAIFAQFSIQPSAIAVSGTPSLMFVQGLNNTGMTASTEVNNVRFQLSATKQWATGAISEQKEFLIDAPTYAFVGASTITAAATVAITDAPIAGTNATITDSYALWVKAGRSRFGGPLQINGTQSGTLNAHFDVNPVAGSSSGLPALAYFRAPANTGITVNTECIGINFNLAATKTWATTAAITTQREVLIQAPTYATAGGSTITKAATLAITNAPIAGANVTITNAYALWVQAGIAQFDGGVTVGTTTLISSSVTLTDGAGAGAGTITNAPTAGNPTKWLLINDNGTTRKIPSWT